MVRTRSDEKRQEIVRVAAEAFQDLGYERTSMLTIAERMSGSKQTLYNYFRSKEDLLRAVLQMDVSEGVEIIVEAYAGEKNFKKALVRLGAAFLHRRLAPLSISNYRTVASQPVESGLGDEFFETALRPGAERICHLFEQLMDEGRLKRAKPWTMAMHWKGLLEQDLFERRLLGGTLEPGEIEAAAKSGTEAFLTIYGNEDAQPKKRRRS